MSSNVEGVCDFCTERVTSRYFKDGKSGHKRCIMRENPEGSKATMTEREGSTLALSKRVVEMEKLKASTERSSMTEREEALLKDLVAISISAQKVIISGSYNVNDIPEVALLREMTAHILRTYTKVKEEHSDD